MVKRTIQLGLPLSGGGPTNDGYPTIFRPTAKEPRKTIGKPRAILSTPRARWLLQLYLGPQACGRRTKVHHDCMALGWTEWLKDSAGDYVYGPGRNARVMEQLTHMGKQAIAHLVPAPKGARVEIAAAPSK